jgi:DNA gyrase subunit B
VLKGLEAVRKRPGMYIGDTDDGSGLHQMVYEAVDNAVDEALAGHATECSVMLNADGSATVRDNGRGIPTDIHPEEGISAAEVVMTQLRAGTMFPDNRNPYKSLCGAGVAVVNALSERLDLTIWRDGKEHSMRFRDGVAEAPLQAVAPAHGRHGTELRFWPSPETFCTVTQFDHATLDRRLRELAALAPGLRIVLRDDRLHGSKPQVIRYPNGASDFLRYLDRSRRPVLDPPIAFAASMDDIRVEVALWWSRDAYGEEIKCFTNAIRQLDGGTHLAGLRAAVARVVTGVAARQARQEKTAITGEDARAGLGVVLSVWMLDPKFSGSTRDRLLSPEVKGIVEGIVCEQLSAWLRAHRKEAEIILARARRAASDRAIRNLARRLPAGRD